MMDKSEIIRIQFDNQNHATINCHGSKIEELTLKNTKILTTETRGDGKKGSTHPCSPIFGPEVITSYGLPQHGPVRNTLFSKEQISLQSCRLTCTIEIGTYPKDISITQTFTIGDGMFRLETTHMNNSNQAAPVNFGEHFYWHTPKGWEKLILNGQDITSLVKSNQVVGLKNLNTIRIPGQPEITLQQENLPYTVLWSYHNKESDTYDSTYVCIEPAEGDPSANFFGTEESSILPRTSRTTKLTISV